MPVVSLKLRLKYVERPAFKVAVFAVCGYECVALASNGQVPTLSDLSSRPKLRWIAPVLISGLAVHLYRYGRFVVSSSHPSDFHVHLE